MSQSEEGRVRAANERFYAAFRAGDLAAMDALWSRRPSVCVFHPNARGIEGRTAVMRSWEAILDEGASCDIIPVDSLIVVSGNSALVVCEEHVSGSRMIATNVFMRESGEWYIVHHQATRLPVAGGNGTGSGQNKRRREERR